MFIHAVRSSLFAPPLSETVALRVSGNVRLGAAIALCDSRTETVVGTGRVHQSAEGILTIQGIRPTTERCPSCWAFGPSHLAACGMCGVTGKPGACEPVPVADWPALWAWVA